MGLVWIPINKPLVGREKEFEKIFKEISNKKATDDGVNELLNKFLSISTSAYETLGAPRVGKDEKATKWAETKFDLRPDKALTMEAFMNAMNGFYAIELLDRHDGIPVYTGGQTEPHCFGATFLKDCEVVAGEEILDEAYSSKLSGEALDYGTRLMEAIGSYAKKNQLEYLKDVRMPPDVDEDSPASKVHIMYSAAKWVLWWSAQGHGFEANY